MEQHVCTPETCPNDGNYYVTAIDGPSVYFMAGPYPTHAEALGKVDAARTIANNHDGKAWFMSWGTSRRKDDYTAPGTLNKHGLI